MSPLGVRSPRAGALLAGLALSAWGLAACGGSSASRSSSAVAAAARTRPSAVYRVALSGRGAPAGAPQGRGDAVIALHGAGVLCWRFAHLHGFSGPQAGRIQAQGSGREVVALAHGARLRHQGCTSVRARVAQAIAADPGAYDVIIPSRQYPAGAVRAVL